MQCTKGRLGDLHVRTHAHLHTDSSASTEISLPELNLDKLTALKYWRCEDFNTIDTL